MDPLAVFNGIFYRFLWNSFNFCGINPLEPNMKVKWYGVLFLLSMVFSWFCCMYTMLTAPSLDAYKAATIFGTINQGILKFAQMKVFAHELRINVEFVRDIYRSNRNPLTSNYRSLSEWSDLFMMILKFYTALLKVAIGAFLVLPVFWYGFTGELIPCFPINIMSIDWSTTHGYVITVMWHVTWMAQAYVGLACTDLVFNIIGLYIGPMVDLFVNLFEDMNNAIRDCHQTADSEDVFRCMGNLVQMQVEMMQYMDRITPAYRVSFFMDLNTNALSLVLTLYCINTQNYPVLYLVLALYFVKLFAICVLGTFVEVKSQQILNVIELCPWYLLPIRQQQVIMLMMAKAQKMTIIRAGTLDLNLNTFIAVMKQVYSASLMLSKVM